MIDFQHNIDRVIDSFHIHGSVARIKSRISEMKCACSDDCSTPSVGRTTSQKNGLQLLQSCKNSQVVTNLQ
jgi:hypothetical protein